MNPFKKFVEEVKVAEQETMKSQQVKTLARLEASMELFNAAIDTLPEDVPATETHENVDVSVNEPQPQQETYGGYDNYYDPNAYSEPYEQLQHEHNGWVQYIDDESGFPYWYNEITGEARWATEEIQQTAEETPGGVEEVLVVPEFVIGPWEKYYDDEGNPFYYNRDTGLSEWEIPAEVLNVSVSHAPSVQFESSIGAQNIPEPMDLGESAETFPNRIAGDFEESTSPKPSVQPSLATISAEGSRVMKVAPSFRSIRSARSFGLHSPHKTIEQIANQLSEGSEHGKSMKKLKSQLSFTLKKIPSVNHNLKPKTPLKSKGKNGFQMLKEGAKLLRQATDSEGIIWMEFQSADDGPIFYASKDSETGQWTKPPVFAKADAMPTPVKSGLEEGSTGSEGSVVEVVDFFSVETEEALKLKSPLEMLARFNNSSKSPVGSPANSVKFAKPKSFSMSQGDLKLALSSTPPIVNSPAAPTMSDVEIVSPQKDAVVSIVNDFSSSLDEESMKLLQSFTQKLQLAQQELSSTFSLSSEINKSVSDDAMSYKLPTILEHADDASTVQLSSHASAAEIFRIDSEIKLIPPTVLEESLEESLKVIPQITESSEVNSNEAKDQTINEPSITQAVASEKVVSSVAVAVEHESFQASPLIVDTPPDSAATESTSSKDLELIPSVELTISEGNEPPIEQTIDAPDDNMWIEICKRSHNIQETANWICLYDLLTKQRFFQRKSDNHCQLERPLDFDSTIELLGTNETIDITALVSEPSTEKLKSKFKKVEKSDANQADSTPKMVTFATPVSSKKVDLDGSIDLMADIQNLESLLDTTQQPLKQDTPPPDEVIDGVINVELLLQQSNAPMGENSCLATELHTFLHDQAFSLQGTSNLTEEEETKQLLQRLALLKQHTLKPSAMNSLLSTHLSTQQYERLKKIEFSKTNGASKPNQYNANEIILENCNNIIEQMETSPIEHLLNHKYLLNALLRHRKRSFTTNSTDYWHNQCIYSFGRSFFPYWPTQKRNNKLSNQYIDPFYCSKLLHKYHMKQFKPLNSSTANRGRMNNSHSQTTNSSNTTIAKSDHFSIYHSLISNKNFFYHDYKQFLQLGKPFDMFMKESNWKMKLESWNEFEINIFVKQKDLQKQGVQLLTDPNLGYVFYCPYRQEYSSTGRFSQSYPSNKKIHTSSNIIIPSSTMKQHIRDNIWDELLYSVDKKNWEVDNEIDNAIRRVNHSTYTVTQQRELLSKALHSFRKQIKDLKQSKLKRSSSFLTLQEDEEVNDIGKAAIEESKSSDEKQMKKMSDEHYLKLTLVNSQSSVKLGSHGDVNEARHLNSQSTLFPTLTFEAQMAPVNYQQYIQHILTIHYHMNNLNLALTFATYHSLLHALLELMSFLLKLGLGKPALGILKYTVDIMKSLSVEANELMEFTFYELLISQLLIIKLSWKFFQFVYNHKIIDILLQQVYSTYLPLPLSQMNKPSTTTNTLSAATMNAMNTATGMLNNTMNTTLNNNTSGTIASNQQQLQQMEYVMFLLTHVACYYKKLQYYEYAEGLLISVLCIQSNYPLACLHYAYLLCTLQHHYYPSVNQLTNPTSNTTTTEPPFYYYKQALRYLQRILDVPLLSNSPSLVTWQRIAKLQSLFLQEYLTMSSSPSSLLSSSTASNASTAPTNGSTANNADENILLTSYKAMINSTTTAKSDSLQASVYVHAAMVILQQALQKKGNAASSSSQTTTTLYENFLVFKEYIQKALQLDEDNQIAYLLLATYASIVTFDVHFQQTLSNGNGLSVPPNTGMQQISQRPLSASNTAKPKTTTITVGYNTIPMDIIGMTSTSNEKKPSSRPTTPTQTGRNTNRPSSATGIRPTTTPAGITASSSNPFSSTQTGMISAASTVGTSFGLPLDEVTMMSNIPSDIQIDAYFRRGIVLLPNAQSYFWVSLLLYAEYQANVMHDHHRALQYYQETVSQTFSTEILPVLALGQYYHYQCNDYLQAKRLYLRALRSRHPHYSVISPHFHEFDGFYLSPLSSNHVFPKGYAVHIYERSNHFYAVTEQLLYELLQCHIHQSHDGDQHPAQRGGNGGAHSSSKSSKNPLYHPNTADSYLHSTTTTSSAYYAADEWKGDEDPISSRTKFPSSSSSSDSFVGQEHFVKEVDDNSRHVVQQRNIEESVLLYINIAYLIWDSQQDFTAAIRYALAAYLLAPHYTPTIRLLGLLVYFHVSKKLGVYFLQLCPDGAMMLSSSTSPSSTGVPHYENPFMMLTYILTKLIKFQYVSSIKGMEKWLLYATNHNALEEIPCLSQIHRTLALTYFLTNPFPDPSTLSLAASVTIPMANSLEKAIYHGYLAYQYSHEQDYEIFRMVAQFYFQLEQYAEAKIYLLKCVVIFPYDSILYSTLALCAYYSFGQYQQQQQKEARYFHPLDVSSGRKWRMEELNEDILLRVAYSNNCDDLFHIAFLLLQWHEEQQLPYAKKMYQDWHPSTTTSNSNSNSNTPAFNTAHVRQSTEFPTSPNAKMPTPQPQQQHGRSSSTASTTPANPTNTAAGTSSQGMIRLFHAQYGMKSYQMIACYLYFQYGYYLYAQSTIQGYCIAKEMLLHALQYTQQIAFTAHHQWMTSMILFYIGKVVEELEYCLSDPMMHTATSQQHSLLPPNAIILAEQYYISAFEGNIPSFDITNPGTIHYSIHPTILLILISTLEEKIDWIKAEIHQLQEVFGVTIGGGNPYMLMNNHQMKIAKKKLSGSSNGMGNTGAAAAGTGTVGTMKKGKKSKGSKKKKKAVVGKEGGLNQQTYHDAVYYANTLQLQDPNRLWLSGHQTDQGWSAQRTQEHDFYTPKRSSTLYFQEESTLPAPHTVGTGTAVSSFSQQYQQRVYQHQQEVQQAHTRYDRSQQQVAQQQQQQRQNEQKKYWLPLLDDVNDAKEEGEELDALMGELSPGLKEELGFDPMSEKEFVGDGEAHRQGLRQGHSHGMQLTELAYGDGSHGMEYDPHAHQQHQQQPHHFPHMQQHQQQQHGLLGGFVGDSGEENDEDEDMAGLHETNIPLESSIQMSLLLKRMMMHQRILELASMKKFSYQKKYKDMVFPSTHSRNTTASHEEEKKKGKAASSSSKAKASATRATKHHAVPVVFFHAEWLEHGLFALARCEDWAWLAQA